MYQSDRPLIQIFLIVVLVLDEIRVDETAQVCAGIPPDIVGVDIDFSQHSDHFCLV